jgi:hypothetical protein
MTMLAFFNGCLPTWETVLVMAMIVLLAGNKSVFGRAMMRGISEFAKAVTGLRDELDQKAHDAGRSLGGIHGKPAAEALTTDNQTREFYDPPQLRECGRSNESKRKLTTRLIEFLRSLAKSIQSGIRQRIYDTDIDCGGGRFRD